MTTEFEKLTAKLENNDILLITKIDDQVYSCQAHSTEVLTEEMLRWWIDYMKNELISKNQEFFTSLTE